MTFNLPSSWSLIKDTRTRTSRGATGGDDGGGGILPGGGYGSRGTRGTRKNKRPASSPSSMMAGSGNSNNNVSGRWWSPYARPPRRSRKLVLLWVGAFLAALLLTWWVRTRHGELARSYAEVLMHEPQKVPVVEE